MTIPLMICYLRSICVFVWGILCCVIGSFYFVWTLKYTNGDFIYKTLFYELNFHINLTWNSTIIIIIYKISVMQWRKLNIKLLINMNEKHIQLHLNLYFFVGYLFARNTKKFPFDLVSIIIPMLYGLIYFTDEHNKS